MAYLTKDQICKANKLEELTLAVPEWGGDVLLRELSGYDRDQYEGRCIDLTTGTIDRDKMMERQAKLVSMSIIDPKTKRLMFESDKDFIQFVRQFNRKPYHRVAAACVKLNGLDKEAREAAAKKSSAKSGKDSNTS